MSQQQQQSMGDTTRCIPVLFNQELFSYCPNQVVIQSSYLHQKMENMIFEQQQRLQQQPSNVCVAAAVSFASLPTTTATNACVVSIDTPYTFGILTRRANRVLFHLLFLQQTDAVVSSWQDLHSDELLCILDVLRRVAPLLLRHDESNTLTTTIISAATPTMQQSFLFSPLEFVRALHHVLIQEYQQQQQSHQYQQPLSFTTTTTSATATAHSLHVLFEILFVLSEFFLFFDQDKAALKTFLYDILHHHWFQHGSSYWQQEHGILYKDLLFCMALVVVVHCENDAYELWNLITSVVLSFFLLDQTTILYEPVARTLNVTAFYILQGIESHVLQAWMIQLFPFLRIRKQPVSPLVTSVQTYATSSSDMPASARLLRVSQALEQRERLIQESWNARPDKAMIDKNLSQARIAFQQTQQQLLHLFVFDDLPTLVFRRLASYLYTDVMSLANSLTLADVTNNNAIEIYTHKGIVYRVKKPVLLRPEYEDNEEEDNEKNPVMSQDAILLHLTYNGKVIYKAWVDTVPSLAQYQQQQKPSSTTVSIEIKDVNQIHVPAHFRSILDMSSIGQLFESTFKSIVHTSTTGNKIVFRRVEIQDRYSPMRPLTTQRQAALWIKHSI